MNQKIITVSAADESALIQEAARIEKQAHAQRKERERCASEKAGRPLVEPVLFFDVPEEAAILQARDQLRKDYAERLQLETPPVLIPALSSIPHEAQEGNGRFHRYDRRYNRGRLNEVVPEELLERFLEQVPAFRDGERLYLWSGTCYRLLPDNEVKAKIKQVLRDELYVPHSTILINAVLALLKMEDVKGMPEFPPHLVALQNGQLDLRTLQLHQPNPACRLVHYLDVPWLGQQPCPIFEAYLWRIAGGDPELIQRFWEAVGYLLVSDYRPKRFVLLQGEGDCGKSVFGNLLISFFRREGYASLADHRFGERFSASTIANAHLCVCMDVPNGVLDGRAVSLLKQITGGDVVSIEAKGRDAYTDHIHCKVAFGSNHAVKLKDHDPAFAKRILLLPFRYPLAETEKDGDLGNKLLGERSGILFRALVAYRDVVNRNFIFSGEGRFGFSVEQLVVEKKEVNGMELFVARCCVLNQEAFTPIEELHGAFNRFCNQLGIPGIVDRSVFSRTLNIRLGSAIVANKRRIGGVPTNGYIGIKLQEGVTM